MFTVQLLHGGMSRAKNPKTGVMKIPFYEMLHSGFSKLSLFLSFALCRESPAGVAEEPKHTTALKCSPL
jgi:hypothetical protein